MLKTGQYFSSFYRPNGLQDELKKAEDSQFSGVPNFIRSLRKHPDVSAAYMVFYSSNFPKKQWWNEIEGHSRASTQSHWDDPSWIISDATATVHEIISPLRCPQKPGAEVMVGQRPKYHPEGIIEKRLIFGVFRGKVKYQYVFLGYYELDKKASFAFSSNNPYTVDAMSFPKNQIVSVMKANPVVPSSDIAAIQSNLITYPHCVWVRKKDTRWPL